MAVKHVPRQCDPAENTLDRAVAANALVLTQKTRLNKGHGENCEAEKENVKDIGCEEECVMQHLDNSSTVDARDRSPDAGRRLKRYNLGLKSHI